MSLNTYEGWAPRPTLSKPTQSSSQMRIQEYIQYKSNKRVAISNILNDTSLSTQSITNNQMLLSIVDQILHPDILNAGVSSAQSTSSSQTSLQLVNKMSIEYILNGPTLPPLAPLGLPSKKSWDKRKIIQVWLES